jgi:DNA-binding CsgD family transcriptional regulator
MADARAQSVGIVGREIECRAVSGCLDAVQAGLAAVVLEGEPGIGKSTIWREAVAQARDRGYRVLACEPSEAEAGMSFAGLGDLLEPVIDELLLELPVPQVRALEAALLRVEAAHSPRDERGVSVAFLSVIRLLCAQCAVVLAIDDVHWLDRPTARVIDFALRRLASAPVGVLASARLDARRRSAIDLERSVDSRRCQRVRLEGLSLAALQRVLQAREGAGLPRRLLLKVHELSRGNPFFAIELTHALAGRGEPLAAGEPLPVPETLSELVAGRLARIGAGAREALLIASALAHPTSSLIEAFDRERDVNELLGKAERHGLIEIDRGRVRFSHPLIASTVYANATMLDRKRVHQRLAEIVPDPEQRARQMALAADGTDEQVAAALEHAADVADARGAPEAAAELCELACQLTPPELSHAARRRKLAGANHHFTAGEWGQARVLGEAVVADGAGESELARALHLLAKIHYYGDSFPEAARLLRDALEHAGDDAAVRAPVELDLTYVSMAFEDLQAADAHARAALEYAQTLDQPGLEAEALAFSVQMDFMRGRGLDRERLQRALDLEDRTRRVPVALRPSLIAGLILSSIGESSRACALFDDLRASLAERGEAQSSLPVMAGIAMVLAYCWHGDLKVAGQQAHETLDAAAQVGTQTARALALAAMATANAYLGEVEDTRRQAQESVELFREAGGSLITVYPLVALGFLHLSLEEPAEADRVLRPVVAMLQGAGLAEPSRASFVANEIEALIGIGEMTLAESLLDAFEQSARAMKRAISLAPAARCRGLLLAAQGHHERAIESLLYAIEQHEQAPRPVDLARTLLVLGQIQRRANRRREGRETLERALAIFEEVGAKQWAKRTRGELARLGLRRDAGGELTPTEEQVAERAASGMTNRQIAGALFISPKTVEANLARVYRKLGISSRAELGRHSAESKGPGAAKT